MSSLSLQQERAHQERRMSAIVWLMLVGMIVMFIWAYFAILDEVTVGTGKVTPSSRAQLIESLDGGIINELLVHEGAIINKGQILARLDPTRFQSNYGEAAARVRTLRASSERLRAELTGAALAFSADTLKEPELVARETQFYLSRRQNLNETVSNLQQSLKLVQQELRMTEPLVAKGAASQVEVIRLQRQISDLRGKIDEARNQYAVRAREE